MGKEISAWFDNSFILRMILDCSILSVPIFAHSSNHGYQVSLKQKYMLQVYKGIYSIIFNKFSS